MKLKLVTIDLDSTLLRDDKSFEEERFVRIVEALKDQGCRVCIATGNMLPKLKDYMPEAVHDDLYMAAENGNYIAYQGEIVKHNGMSRTAAREVWSLVKDDPEFHVMVSTGTQGYVVDYSDELFDNVSRYFNIKKIDSFAEIPQEATITRMGILSEKPLSEDKRFLVEVRHNIEGISAVTSEEWIDVYVSGGGKGFAMKYLQDKYDIAIEETLSFGDSYNDAPMAVRAGYSVAMGNADPDFKKFCSHEIGNNNDQAVIALLEEYLEEGNLDFMDKYKRI